jgi:hypothetical protein
VTSRSHRLGPSTPAFRPKIWTCVLEAGRSVPSKIHRWLSGNYPRSCNWRLLWSERCPQGWCGDRLLANRASQQRSVSGPGRTRLGSVRAAASPFRPDGREAFRPQSGIPLGSNSRRRTPRSATGSGSGRCNVWPGHNHARQNASHPGQWCRLMLPMVHWIARYAQPQTYGLRQTAARRHRNRV